MLSHRVCRTYSMSSRGKEPSCQTKLKPYSDDEGFVSIDM